MTDDARDHAPWLDRVAHLLPSSGRALDVAGGSGRNARWLVARGFAVTLVDVEPEALARAAGPGITTSRSDLEREAPPAGPWNVILCTLYLQRDLFRVFPSLLAPNGVLVFAQPTVRNLERHAHPSRRWLLEEGELARLLPPLEPAWLAEGWTDEGTHEARAVARRSEER